MAVLGPMLRPTRLSAHTSEQVQHCLQVVGCALAGGEAVVLLPEHDEQAQAISQVCAEGGTAAPGTALVVGTSGSTGVPKLAMLRAEALRASASATAQRLGGHGQWLLALPAHTVAGVQVVVRSLLAGCDPVPLPAGRFTAQAFTWAAAGLHPGKLHYTALVPTQLGRLLEDRAAQQVLRRFDAVLLGGAPAPARMLKTTRELGIRVVTTYGMTETCGGCVYDGHPLEGVAVRLEPDTQRVLLAGPMLFSGYLGQPELTAATLREGWLHTNDHGHLDPQGQLSIAGRLDDIIISGGVNVSLAAVEHAASSLPALAQAEVLAVALPDQQWGHTVALVTTAAPPPVEQVRAHVAARLGPAAAPRAVMQVAAIPLLASGKPDRLAVRENFLRFTVDEQR